MIIKLQDLARIREENANNRIVFISGSFDLIHYEHIRFIEEAQNYGDVLVVGVKSNHCVAFKGPGRPIINETQRVYIVDAIKGVDYTFIARFTEGFETSLEYENCKQLQWLAIFEKVFEYLKPDIWVHENAPELKTVRESIARNYGVRSIPRERGKEISTTEIIGRLE